MSERFYKIGNTWYPWQTAHGLYGYTKTPTIRITYISTSQATWGQPESGYGFFDGDASEPQDGSYFHTSTWGWFDADSMAKTIWLMPSECEIDDIFFENDGDISPGARLIIDPSVTIDEEDWRYLIASVRNLGWHTLDEWEELGWVLTDPNTLYFGGDFSGNNILMESVDGGGGLIDKYASYKALFELRGWEPGGNIEEWEPVYMVPMGGVLDGTSDSITEMDIPVKLTFGHIEFTGELRPSMIPMGGVMYEGTIIGGIITQYHDLYFTANMNELIGVIEEYDPAPTNYIDIVLGIRWDVDNGGWLAKTFAINDWWWSGILSQTDLSRLQALGCDYCQTTNMSTAYPGLIGAVKYDDRFYYDLLELYDEIGDQPAPIESGFYFAELTSTADRDYTGCLIIYARYGYTRPIKSYKVRITKKEEYIDVILGFRWDTSLNDWRSINFDYALEDNNWWGCFISSDDATKLSRYGVEVGSASWLGDNGGLLYSDDFTFEVLEVYSELDQPVTGYDLSTFEIRSVSNSASTHMLSIFNTQQDATMLKFWKCRIVPCDTVTGTIANIVLPTAHSGQYLSVMFSSLRYYAKGTLINTGVDADTAYCGRRGDWYYGTLQWTDESLGDLSDKIAIQDPSELNIDSKQTVFRIIFISDAAIAGYHPSDTTQENYGFISGYSYIGGVHTITFYYLNTNWIGGAYVGRIQLRYLDEVTQFRKLSAFDLVDVSSGTLSKATTTDRYDMYNTWNGDITVIAKYN